MNEEMLVREWGEARDNELYWTVLVERFFGIFLFCDGVNDALADDAFMLCEVSDMHAGSIL